MNNICVAKRLVLWILIWTVLPLSAVRAQEKVNPTEYMDSVQFSLVTCSPHEEVYSLYGHTALRYVDFHQEKPADLVFNWGVFNFIAPHFVSRFVFGLTDYELEIADFNSFCKYYQRWGSSVVEQVLNLTAEEKVALNIALQENYKPENRVYRYNYFYDNCSTRPRDIIERCISGKVVYNVRSDYEPSFREMIHQMVSHHPWAMFGNDMLLGVKADAKTKRQEQEFLPENLLYDFDHAVILNIDGTERPLVSERHMLVKPGVQVITSDFILTPLECAVILAILSVVFFAAEWKHRKTFKYWDALLMLLMGLAGCVLFVMVFSQHPCTSLNLQLLLLNPVHLFYLPSVLRRRSTHYWKVLPAMTVLFFLGSLLQDYAQGMTILALCLLLRIWIHFRNEK